MKARITLGLLTAAFVATLVTAGALATGPGPGLSSTLLARFTVGAGTITATDGPNKLQLNFDDTLDLAVVKATLTAGGQTGWHAHPMDSVVAVTQGSLTVSMPDPIGKRCLEREYSQGEAFLHGKDVHNFVGGPSGAEFYVLYMAPVGAALGDFSPPVPEGCA